MELQAKQQRASESATAQIPRAMGVDADEARACSMTTPKHATTSSRQGLPGDSG